MSQLVKLDLGDTLLTNRALIGLNFMLQNKVPNIKHLTIAKNSL